MAIEKEIQILEDGKNNWKEKKELSLQLANSFLRLSQKKENELIKDNLFNKYNYIKDCSSYLEFSKTTDGNKKLINARFCRVRLCPMCSWRRSKKIFAQVSKIIQEVNKDKPREYIFLTLTCKNVQATELREQIKHLLQAFKKMFDGNSKIKKICLGYFRGLEVTRNNDNGTYHPHIHCIICVNKSYFRSRDYIKQKEWRDIWQHYLKLEYNPVVHIEKANKSYKSISELSKYTVKSKDIFLNTEKETDQNIITVHNALHRVRLIGMGGLFKEYHKKLNLDNPEDENANLVNTETEPIDKLATDIILKYNWHVGYKNYILVTS